MNTLNIISPLQQFQKLMPLTGIIEQGEELRYIIRNAHTARFMEEMAQGIILANRLPITAKLKDRALVVKMVPEPYTFQDEVTDDENYIEEKAEWL